MNDFGAKVRNRGHLRTFGLMLCLTFNNSVHAAAGSVWATAIGGSGSDQIQSVAVDPRGPIVSAGYFQSSLNVGSTNLSSAGGEDIIVTKFTADGAPIWAKRFGGSGDDRANGVAVDAQGNVVVAGQFSGTVDFGSGPRSAAGSTDIFVAKLSGAGDLLWVRTYGGATIDSASSVAVDAQGKIFVTGSFQGTVDFGAGSVKSSPFADSSSIHNTFLMSLGKEGQLIWLRRANNFDSNRAAAVAVDRNGDVLITGSFISQFGFLESGTPSLTSSVKTLFVAKFSGTTGRNFWTKAFLGSDSNEAFGIATDFLTGNVAVAGYFRGSVRFVDGTATAQGGDDLLVLLLDGQSGTQIWRKTVGSAADERASACAFDRASNVFVTGSFSNTVDFGGATMSSQGGSDLFLVRYSVAGLLTLARRYGGISNDSARSVETTVDGLAVIGGSFQGTANLGTGSVTSVSNSPDGFVSQINLQSAPGTWAKTVGDVPGASISKLAKDISEYIFAVGNFANSLSVEGRSLISAGSSDLLVVKYRADGTLLWAKAYGGTGTETPQAALCDRNGNLYVAGNFFGSSRFGGSDVYTSATAPGGFLAKYSPSGDLIWCQTIPNMGSLTFSSLALDAAQTSILVAGTYAGVVQFSAGVTLTSNSLVADSCLLKFNAADGRFKWVKTFPNGDQDFAVSVQVDKFDNVFLTGVFRFSIDVGFGKFISPTSGSSSDDTYVVNLGKTGDTVPTTAVWARQITGNVNQSVAAMALDSNGDVYVAGTFSSPQIDLGGGALTPVGASRLSLFAAKYRGQTGDYVWGQIIACNDEATIMELALDPLNHPYLAGHVRDGNCTFDSQVFYTSENSTDGFLARFNGTSGAPASFRLIGSQKHDFLNALSIDSFGLPIIAGNFSGPIAVGNVTLTPPALGSSAFLGKVDP